MFYDYNSFFFVISPSKNESFWKFSGILEPFPGNSGKNFGPYFGNYVANPINDECWFNFTRYTQVICVYVQVTSHC